MYVGPEMFKEVTDREVARRTFASTVVRVEMETHSYCNRRCSYCPNVVGDRLMNLQMPPDIWEKIIGGLEEIDYKWNLVLNYYNEPLADRSILDRIREARRRLPKARIMIYSNGDYLQPGYIDELADAGLDYLHISIHLKRGDEYTDEYVTARIREVGARAKIRIEAKRIVPGEYLIAEAPHPRMEIEVRAINFYKHGTDRGGLIDDIETAKKRSSPCTFVFSHFVIGYNGLIAPCCHIRSDRPEHEPYIYGNVRDYETIFHAFASARAAAWRREMGGGQEKRSPCDTCAAGMLEEPQRSQMIEMHRRFAGEATPPVAAE